MANPLLALQVQPANIDAAGSLMRGQEMQTAKLGNLLAQYQLRKAQKADEQANALSQLYREIGPGLVEGEDAAVNRLAQVDPMAALGVRKEGLGIQKAEGDIARGKQEIKKADIEIALDRADFIARSAAGILEAPPAARPLLYKRALQQAQGIGMDVSGAPQDYDENAVKAMMAQGLTIKDRIAQEIDRERLAETKRSNRASEGLTARGQNMVDARARAAANQPKDAPAGYRYKADGNLEVIPGGPADSTGFRGKATDTQRVTALYADRAKEANRILGTGGREEETASVVQRGASKIPVLGNYLVGEKFQEADQAKRDFVNAVLRRESGAVISDAEFDNADKQYFAQPGDSKSVIQQKRRNRELAVKGLERAAGSALDLEARTTPSTPEVIDFNDLPDN